MIDSISIKNFKVFKDLALRARPLTVLTGLNGTGKSTVIQALLLARQATEDPGHVVQLNGPYGLGLGEALDILHPEANTQVIGISLSEDLAEYSYEFRIPSDRSLNLEIASAPNPGPQILAKPGSFFSYLSAERLGPRDQLDATADDRIRINVGVQGEYTAQALALNETLEISSRRQFPYTDQKNRVKTLRTHVELWASQIIRPIRITAQWPAGITASIIRFQDPTLLTDPIRPANIGFGFSYALPVIVAGLLTPPGGILIVENPEAHLHPAGQSRIGFFLAKVANAGVQVIVETHSDHVINGIRLATLENENLAPEDAIIHFFGAGERGQPTSIDFTSRGGLSSWPTGFFDQIEHDLGELARAKRREGPASPRST